MSDFDVRRYQNENNTLVDGSDSLANIRKLVISFYHVPSGRSVFFKAFITAFNESYNSNFTPHEAFGRTDPIYQYKNTTRKITLAFKVLAASESEAFENLGRISALEQMLYPSYKQIDSATTLSQAPLIRLKVMNLAQTTDRSDASDINVLDTISETRGALSIRQVLYNSYKSTSDPKRGLLGIVENLQVNHNLESDDGAFFKRNEVPDPETGRLVAKPIKNTILPKFIDINLSFSPIHEHTQGWGLQGSTQPLFPYEVSTEINDPAMAQASVGYNSKEAADAAVERNEKINQQLKDVIDLEILKEKYGEYIRIQDKKDSLIGVNPRMKSNISVAYK